MGMSTQNESSLMLFVQYLRLATAEQQYNNNTNKNYQSTKTTMHHGKSASG